MTIIQYNHKKSNWYFFRILSEAGNFIVLGGTFLLHDGVFCNLLNDICNSFVICKLSVNEKRPLYVGVCSHDFSDI